MCLSGSERFVVHDRDQARSAGHRHGLEEHGIDQREHHSVQADSQGKREDHDGQENHRCAQIARMAQRRSCIIEPHYEDARGDGSG